MQRKNQRACDKFFVPCFFHNSSVYDSHMLIKHLHKRDVQITVIPQNTEKFIGFQIDGVRYLDSFKFLPSSLDHLVKNLHNDGTGPFRSVMLTN